MAAGRLIRTPRRRRKRVRSAISSVVVQGSWLVTSADRRRRSLGEVDERRLAASDADIKHTFLILTGSRDVSRSFALRSRKEIKMLRPPSWLLAALLRLSPRMRSWARFGSRPPLPLIRSIRSGADRLESRMLASLTARPRAMAFCSVAPLKSPRAGPPGAPAPFRGRGGRPFGCGEVPTRPFPPRPRPAPPAGPSMSRSPSRSVRDEGVRRF